MINAVPLLLCLGACYSQTQTGTWPEWPAIASLTRFRNALTQKMGNFTTEFLYHTSVLQPPGQNVLISPITVWTALAVISEGAGGDTKSEILQAIWPPNDKVWVRRHFGEIRRRLKASKADIIDLVKFNGIFIDRKVLPLVKFQEDAKLYYDAEVIYLNFNDTKVANLLNSVISNYTHGRISSLVQSRDFKDTPMVLSSSLFFKGKWKIPFNVSSTRKQPFYDSDKNQIGEVNMMYNRASYPVAEIKVLQARVVELPMGQENRLSMIIMLPNYGVSLENMLANFQRLSLDTFFNEFEPLIDDFSHTEVELYLPRFQIKSDLDLTEVLKQKMAVVDLFDAGKAFLPNMSSNPLYVSKFVHKAEIEVTEDSTAASAVNTAEFSNGIGVVWFEANRPFTYMIVEKTTNTIVLVGFFRQPSLY